MGIGEKVGISGAVAVGLYVVTSFGLAMKSEIHTGNLYYGGDSIPSFDDNSPMVLRFSQTPYPVVRWNNPREGRSKNVYRYNTTATNGLEMSAAYLENKDEWRETHQPGDLCEVTYRTYPNSCLGFLKKQDEVLTTTVIQPGLSAQLAYEQQTVTATEPLATTTK